MLIKVFTFVAGAAYEDKINEFIKDKNVIDIKFRDVDVMHFEVIILYNYGPGVQLL